ncbi:hypothetical protein KVR01_001698 [Diaporthe batatas]|uniref:uncharacterized protein n=1 Tax=Diaporthe batatas TaxID=748121 RepID=UPI001D047FB3|nr:uncharacterized protein KVR01_001698 [Diaporthe batatas]KAG8168949.1 hypothetical protein KVR01_001698 [Diaporthe batatas]
MVAFTIAGGFSSTISTGVGNEVLLDGSNCAFINVQDPDLRAQSILGPYQTRQANTANNYAQQCYSANMSGMFDCGTFVKPRISSYVDNQTACPFAEGMCQSDANLQLDTGYIDIHETLGLNTPSNERVMFRSVLKCAPLVTEGYTTSDGNYTVYNYGRHKGNNYTLRARSSDAQYTTSGNEFKLVSLLTYVVNGTIFPSGDNFTPNTGLSSPEGDLVLTFLLGDGIKFLEKADDPWYRVNTPGPNITTKVEFMTYKMDEPASPLACLRQYQFCNPALPEEGRCGPLRGFLDAQFQAAPLFDITYDQMVNMTVEQMATNDFPQTPAAARYAWLLMFLALQVPSPATLVDILGPNTLTSQQSLTRSSGIIGMIPSYQWQLDIQNLWAIYMASLQAGTVNIAYGTHSPALKPYEIPPSNSHMQKLCESQKILSSIYTSFSVFGLCIIYVIGFLIVLISYLLEPIQAWLYRRHNLKEDAYLEWIADETLQLQRMAYQGLKSGHWSRYTDQIPLTEAGETLADLARSYPLEERNKKPDVEQGYSTEKPDGTTVITVEVSTSTLVESDAGSTIPCDDNPQADMPGVGERQTAAIVSPANVPGDDSFQPPAVPDMKANPRRPACEASMGLEKPRS